MHCIRFSLCIALFACGKVAHEGDDSAGDVDGAPPGFQTLEVTVSGDGAVTSDPPGIDCPDTCSFNFPEGSEVTLTPVPAPTADLAAWDGDCAGFAGCAVTMDTGRAVDARFGAHGSKRWVNQVSFMGQDFIENDVVVDPEGNPIIAGSIDDNGIDLYVAKYRKDTGELAWENRVDTSGESTSNYYGGLAVDGDGNAYAAISLNGFGTITIAGTDVTADVYGNIVLMRFAASDGHIEWVKQWGGDGQDRPHALAISGTNIFIAAESSSSPIDFDGTVLNGSIDDGVVVKARTANGNATRAKLLDTNIQVRAIAVSDTRVAIAGGFSGTYNFDACGISSSGTNSPDGYVAQLAQTDLSCQWAQDFGDLQADQNASASGVAAYPGGGWVATGSFSGNVLFAESGSSLGSHGSLDAFAVRYAANGDHIWSFRYGGTGFDVGTAIATTADGSTLLTGSFAADITFGTFDLTGVNDAFVTRMSSGNAPTHEWAVALGGDGTDWPEGIALDAAGYVYVLSYFMGMTEVDGQGMTALDYDAWLAAIVR
jgi:hypothetical protein